MSNQISNSISPKYDTVIFDLDGTLLYTLTDLRSGVNMAMHRFGWMERSYEEMRHFVGNGIRNLMNQAVPGGEQNPLFEEAFAAFKESYAAVQTETTGPYDGIPEAVEELQKHGVKMAIVSNKIDSAVKALNDDFFHMNIALGEQEGIARKPAPDSVYYAMKQLGADPAKTVYVGDSDVDIRTAENAGLPCISAEWGFRTREELLSYGATCIAATPEEMTRIILGTEE